jgi:hypothetical protein
MNRKTAKSFRGSTYESLGAEAPKWSSEERSERERLYSD